MSARLEYLRGQIRAEQISMGECIELQGLADEIDPGDVELLEWAGVPEHEDDGLPYEVYGDDEHGYGITQHGVLMPDERHSRRETAQIVADFLNDEGDA